MQRYLIIAVLLGAIGWLVYDDFFKPDPEETPEIPHSHEAIQSERVKIDSLAAAVERLEDKMTSDSLKNIVVHSAFKSKIRALAKSRVVERSKVQELIDTIPVLKSFVALQDSTIQAYSARVDSLESEKARQWSDFNKLLDIQEEKFQAATEINLHLSAINDHYREENRKLKRQNRWLKVSIGGAFVAGLLLTQ